LSGNKIRKLGFLLADAKAQGCDIVLTCGGIQSNHCRATAIAARQIGMDSLLFLRTADPQAPLPLVGNTLLDQLVGADIRTITPEAYRQRSILMQEAAERLQQEGRRPYLIPEGGSNALGSWGYLDAIRELSIQLAELGEEIDDIVFACGSGGTAAGIAAAAHLAKLPTRIHAVTVCDDASYFYQHINQCFAAWGIEKPAEEALDIIDGYKGLGYAISQESELRYLLDTAKQTGILLDPVYTGKALYGFAQEMRLRPERFQGSRLLFWHTGGIFGLFAQIAQILPLLGA
jgi:D-cysteine desulfhydrase